MDTVLSKDIESDWKRCVDFHGHECPGLAIGFMAARAGLKWIEGHRSEDEEIVAVVENDACGVDGVQVLTGCTFGKGNLIYRDHGKQVFTFFNRATSRGARFSLKAGAVPQDDRHRQLMMKMRDGLASPEERAELAERRAATMIAILSKNPEELFAISEPIAALPEKAIVQKAEPCAVCGEPTMPAKMIERNGGRFCRPCAQKDATNAR